MDTQTIIRDSAQYIEAHLKEPLSVEMLAARAGFSPYHFCRLFCLYMEMPVMEYIRRRRLSLAAYEVCEGRRILDVAMDYGFESHNGFSKAFRKIYGYSPDEFRRRSFPHRPLAPNPLAGQKCTLEREPVVRIQEREGFFVAGMVVRTSQTISSIAQEPAIWNKVWLEEWENKIYAAARPRQHGEYYISFPVPTGLYRLVTCVRIEDPESVDDGLYVDWVPPGLYGIFTTPPVEKSILPQTVVDTWRYIYEQWLPQSGYAPDTQGLDYEFYDERCNGAPYSMDICIPLKKK